MHKITFECQVITPMFLAGADPNQPELRPPSIKGAMRFWWRAMNGHLGLEELKEREGLIFGNTSQQSQFKIKYTEIAIKSIPQVVLPHKERSFKKNAIAPRQQFKLDFLSKNNDTKILIENLFPLTCVLGALGGRSRRGFGSVKITNTNYPNSLKEIIKLLDKVSPNNFEYLPHVNKIVGKFISRLEYPYIREIEIGRVNNDLTKKIGRATHDTMGKDKFGYEKAVGSPRPRFASPIYVSVVTTDQGEKPIITTLQYPKANRRSNDIQDNLKNRIL